MTGNNAGEWVRAWESQMAKRGYPPPNVVRGVGSAEVMVDTVYIVKGVGGGA